jgi:hypothetical protein
MNANYIIKCIYKEQNSIQPLNSSDEHFKVLRMSPTKYVYFAILVDCSHCYLMTALHFQMQKTEHNSNGWHFVKQRG